MNILENIDLDRFFVSLNEDEKPIFLLYLIDGYYTEPYIEFMKKNSKYLKITDFDIELDKIHTNLIEEKLKNF